MSWEGHWSLRLRSFWAILELGDGLSQCCQNCDVFKIGVTGVDLVVQCVREAG